MPEETMTYKDSPEEKARLMVRDGLPWRLFLNEQGHAIAIGKGKWMILHLNVGTVRNEACVQEVVDLLNEVTK